MTKCLYTGCFSNLKKKFFITFNSLIKTFKLFLRYDVFKVDVLNFFDRLFEISGQI